ncbi:MAG TPA: hypothetical protein VN731_10400 [Rhodanobacter sp.]|nr:hypothetical protein [Rhodanobacter sp.]
MTTFVFANNISTQLASPVSSGDTTITLSSTAGLPSSIPAGSVLVITLNDQATHAVFEILYATAITGATLTVMRAQESTTALSWSTGDVVFSGPTAGQMQGFYQGAGSGRLVNTVKYTSSGSWTPAVGATKWRIRGTGGGGGGAASTTSGAGVCSATAFGQSAAAGEFWFTGISGTQTVTIGGGGLAGVTNGAAGGNGGNTVLGSLLTLPGGKGSLAVTPAAAPYNSAGPTTITNPTVGAGGSTVWSIGTTPAGGGNVALSNTVNASGFSNSSFGGSAQGFGAGGNGTFTAASNSFSAGGAGNSGFLFIEEYA